jgi:lipoprotein-anchoring transpeptidase ErfK/SrfK
MATRYKVVALLLLTSSTVLAQLTAPSQKTREQQAIVKLFQLRYFVDTTKSDKVAINKQAIIAFQKVHKLKRTGILSKFVIDTILRSVTPRAADSLDRLHIEVDLKRQVLFLVDSNNVVQTIVSVSTGNGKRFLYPEKGWRYAITPKGQFKVYYKVKGWRVSKLGLLYNPMYVVGGVAIHGALDVPPVPASHGCVRIPFFTADKLFSMIRVGTPVAIY